MLNDNIHAKLKKNCIYFGNIIFNLFGWQSWVGISLQTFALVLAIINFNKTSGWQMWVWITSPDILQWGWQGGSSNNFFYPKSYFFCELKPHAKFQNPTISPSGIKVTWLKKEKQAGLSRATLQIFS